MENIKEIQQNFADSMNKWSDVMLEFDVKQQDLLFMPEPYSAETVMNLTLLFSHVCMNYGVFSKKLTNENVTEFGTKLHELIRKYVGINTITYYSNPRDN